MHIEQKQSRCRSRKTWVALAVLIGGLLLITAYFVRYRTAPWNMLGVAVTNMTAKSEPFPTIDTTDLPPARQQIIALAKQEYAAQPTATKYSEGIKEAWCADFLSWIMKEVDAPLANPNSGSWRIPGVYTLKDYYQSIGAFHTVDSGYEPVPGDAAIYYDSPIFGTHVNIVLENKDGVLTTVGGNEDGKVRVYKNTAKNYAGLVGYGVVK